MGCSTGSCKYLPNTGINLPNNDIWHTLRRVEIENLPTTQNEFNILVPVTPFKDRYSYSSNPLPYLLTIAFFTRNHSIGDATGLFHTLSVYRIYGPALCESISGSIGTINGLARRGTDLFGPYFSNSNPNSYTTSVLSFVMDTSNINLNKVDNRFDYGYNGTFTTGQRFGCGITITSLHFNIFKESTLHFEEPPVPSFPYCSIFSYRYNEQTAGQNFDRDGKWIHTVFCPVDASLNFNSHAANIHFKNPQYPPLITEGFDLSTIITYGISSP